MAKHADAEQLDDRQLTEEEVEELADHDVNGEADDETHDPVAETDRDAKRLDRTRFSVIGSAIALGVAVVIATGGLSGWLGYQAYQAHRAQQDRDLVIESARQAAVNLTTINFAEAERDIERILESATGKFHDDFQARSEPFVEAVKQAQSKSEGTVQDAGIVSHNADQTDVLVAISVKTSIPGAAEQPPRSWRLRISVRMLDNAAKVSDVQFVV